MVHVRLKVPSDGLTGSNVQIRVRCTPNGRRRFRSIPAFQGPATGLHLAQPIRNSPRIKSDAGTYSERGDATSLRQFEDCDARHRQQSREFTSGEGVIEMLDLK